MMPSRAVIGLLSLVLVLGTARSAAQETSGKSPIEQIRKNLLHLPYYGVFDYLAFGYDKGTVTLVGYAYRPTLKADAERAAKRAPGVDRVINKIEVLPVSPMDDELRWKIYYSIYGDEFLSRYAPGGSVLWGHRHPLTGSYFGYGGPFPGFEPAGDYPIRIIVKNGRVMLLGVVDSEMDKRMAEVRAREVPGSFEVQNLLVVDKEGESASRQ
jgi:hypothetical protein